MQLLDQKKAKLACNMLYSDRILPLFEKETVKQSEKAKLAHLYTRLTTSIRIVRYRARFLVRYRELEMFINKLEV